MASDEWTHATNELMGIARDALLARVSAAARPDRLFHFTDCAGLIGILEKRSLWASLATSLNDQSEIEYGLARARSLIQRRAAGAEPSFLDSIGHFLDPSNTLPFITLEWRIFIVSLCARADRSVHWLHYGRSGTGFAIALDSSALEQNAFNLVPVVYVESQQDERLRAIIEPVWTWFDRQVAQGFDDGGGHLKALAANIVAMHIWAAIPMLKNPAFASEEEWRLTAFDLGVRGQPRGGGMHFRSAGGRVVPYKTLVFDTLPVTEIVLGASVPMVPDDPALATLLQETAGARPIKITRSTVPVRL